MPSIAVQIDVAPVEFHNKTEPFILGCPKRQEEKSQFFDKKRVAWLAILFLVQFYDNLIRETVK